MTVKKRSTPTVVAMRKKLSGSRPRRVAHQSESSVYQGRMSGEQASRDDEPLDLTRSLVDLQNFGVAHQLLDRIFFHVAVAPEDLYGVHRRQHRCVGAERFCVARND